MDKQIISFREYKIMLHREQFAGSEEQLMTIAGEFWSDVRTVLDGLKINPYGQFNEIRKRQTIRFFDSEGHRLHENAYLYRERVNIESGKRELTLKFRHPDRYIAQDRDMKAKKLRDETTKLEEDIKALFRDDLPFFTLYSFSTTGEARASTNPTKMKDLVESFPGLQEGLANYDGKVAISPVGNFTALEVVLTGAFFQIEASVKQKAECALIVWYEYGKPSEPASNPLPEVVEFSFRYEDLKGRKGFYSRDMSQRAFDFFREVQRLSWVNPASKTKTNYMYERLKSESTEE